MGFDGIFLHKLKDEINLIKTGRITKINEITPTSFIFVIRANKENYNLYLNFNSDNSRIHLTNRNYNHVLNPKAFTLFLKKNLEGFFISNIEQYETDRIITITCEGYNEMRDHTKRYLICEVMGRSSNFILTDDNFIIIDSLHKDGVGEFNRIIMPQVKYQYPTITKLNPYKINHEEFSRLNIENPKELVSTFLGVSNTFANLVFEKENIEDEFFKLLSQKFLPSTFLNINNKNDYYYFANNPIKTYQSISNMLDDIYYENDKNTQIKRETNDLLKFVNRQITKFEGKIVKLEEELNVANNADIYRIYGELLLQSPNLKEKTNKITVYNYYDNKEIMINLDSKLDILGNSQKYYKKYQKLKKSIAFINEQKTISLDELNYFKLLKAQIETANLNDVLEIEEELVKYKYLKSNTKTNQKKKRKPNILTYIVDDTLIYVGKNNIQNEYITHELAKANNLWFHVKDGSGSHVVIAKNDDFTEDEIRTAAKLAAYYSPQKNSSSVAVDYTKARFIKKIPGKRNCFVTYTNQKTIYIDPIEEEILKLKVKK